MRGAGRSQVPASRTLHALLLFAAIPFGVTAARAAEPTPVPRELVGQTLYVLNPTTVRTRGGGNIAVDLPRGQAVVLLSLAGDRAFLAPSPSDAGLLRAYGVRRTPRYIATAAQLAADCLPRQAWEKARGDAVRHLLARWPDLDEGRADKIFLGQPFVGMTEEQAEEAVGPLVLSREPVPGDGATMVWKVGRRPRTAELRLYNEARERGRQARSFEEFLSGRVRALVTVRAGVVVSLGAPDSQTPGLNWP